MSTVYIPKRKNLRYKGYDYSENGVYYITICTSNNKNRFGKLEPIFEKNGLIKDVKFIKTEIGQAVEDNWHNIPKIYPYIFDDCFTIMPDHIHGILILYRNFPEENIKSIPEIIAAFKSVTTRIYKKKYGRSDSLWQRNFYETIIQNEKQYKYTVDYIENNQMVKLMKIYEKE